MKGDRKDFGESLCIFIISSFTVAQPVFDLISRNVDWLIERRWERLDVLASVVLLCFLLPASLVLVNGAARMFGPRIQRVVFGLTVTSLIAGGILPALRRFLTLPEPLTASIAVTLGAVFAVGLSQYAFFKKFAVLLSPGLVLFPALFLLNSTVYKIVFPGNRAFAVAAPIGANTPILLVIFDELPLTSLMNEKREIDASHYPNFAALARDGTLFRNITTSSDTTVRAVPAILTGRYPVSFSLPITADHPDNICTLLAATHRLETAETVTDLCGGERARPQDSKGRLRTILSDVSVVYLQLLLPEVSARRFLIFQTWDDPEREFTRFIERVRPAESPGFYFIHALVPHAPYWRLPSGKFYVESPLEPSGQGDQWGSWDADEWPVIQSFQRHLLQVGFADNLLGNLLTRLREVGLYDESLIVVTSDHGVSFRPGDSRRGLSATNLADILSVPVLIKTPFQRQGEISDVLGSTVDIVPTIADILSIPLPWATDGRSLLDNEPPDGRAIYFDGAELVAVDRPALEAKYDTLRQKLEWFPARDGKERRFNVGPGTELIGETIESLEVQNAAGAYVELFESHHFKDVDPGSHFIPAQIVGKLGLADGVLDSTARLAIAINGVICATTQTYGPTGGGLWSAVANPRCFQPGENRVEAFIINSLEDRFTLMRPLPLAIKSN